MDRSFNESPDDLVELDVRVPVWDEFFMVMPLVVVGSREENGEYDFAPKHMVTPMGWKNYFGFVCTSEHATYQNVKRTEQFTVSFPKADSVVLTSLTASPRCEDSTKPSLGALPRFSTKKIDGEFLKDSTLFFECELDRIVDGFAANSLIVGRIVRALIKSSAKRSVDVDDQEVIDAAPLLAYLTPGRYATIDRSRAFPFPAGFQRTKDSQP